MVIADKAMELMIVVLILVVMKIPNTKRKLHPQVKESNIIRKEQTFEYDGKSSLLYHSHVHISRILYSLQGQW